MFDKGQKQSSALSCDSSYYIRKELKYATHNYSAVTYVFDVVIKSHLDLSCRLLVACDEI